MPPDLHVHAGRLHAHADTAAGLAEDLRAAAGRWPAAPGVEAERLHTAVRRAIGELVELSAVLAGAASAAQTADQHTATMLRRAHGAP